MVTSPLLEEVERARRATICEEEVGKGVMSVENVNDNTIENEEKELVMAFNVVTLNYKDRGLEESFSADLDPHFLLVVEVILSMISLLCIYIYFPKRIFTSIALATIVAIELLVTIVLICFCRDVLRWWIIRHLLACLYLLSPLVLLFLETSLWQVTLPVFVLFLSTHLTLGSSLSHLIKTLLGLLSIAVYLPLLIVREQIPGSLTISKQLVAPFVSF